MCKLYRFVSECGRILSDSSALRRHYEAFRDKGRACVPQFEPRDCFFCGFGPEPDGVFNERLILMFNYYSILSLIM